MSLPSSGQLTFIQIYTEVYGVAPGTTAMNLKTMYNYSTLTPKTTNISTADFYGYTRPAATLSLSPTTWTFVQGGGNKVITVTASTGNSWLASSDRAWLTFSGSNSGIGNGSFTIVAAVNSDGPPDRTGTITVVSSAPDASVAITQSWH